MNIKTVTILGANGIMGSNVAGIFASFGEAKVYMISRKLDDSIKAKASAALSVKAEAIEINLIPKSYDDLKECISTSDLIFESVSEDINIKKDIYSMIKRYLRPSTIIGTGTSGLSINELSNCFDDNQRQNFMGIHLYNPPYNMILCEVIPSKYTNLKLVDEMKSYLRAVLHRKVVEVKDEAAFMGNRIGFYFINEALQYAEKYKQNGGIDYIDTILGPFTGRNMAPLSTSDFVGLDVHKAIVDNIYSNTNDYAHDSFYLPEFAKKLISENKLGRKTNCGLYQMIKNSDGTKKIYVYDINNDTYRPKGKYNFPFIFHMIDNLKNGNYRVAFDNLINEQSIEADICVCFLIKYVVYSLTIAKAIGESLYSADDVMATGFNWVPPLAVIDAFGGVNKFKIICLKKMSHEFLSIVNIDEILREVPKSHYDFRPFFKAR